MYINTRSQNVDVKGYVSHPILHNWKTNRNHRSLTVLLNNLQEDFGKVTPVAKKTASQVQKATRTVGTNTIVACGANDDALEYELVPVYKEHTGFIKTSRA